MKQKHFYILIALVILSRISLLFNGYGADGDAWRIARTSLDLWNNGIYRISRIPGFPVYEFLNAPIIGLFGSLGSNIATLLVFNVSIFIFKKIIERLNIPHQNIVLILYAFFPMLWKNSALTMDYVWGLCGVLASLLGILNRKFVFAGIFLGIAAGTRLTHLVFLFSFFFLFEKADRKFYMQFFFTALLTTIILYIPVFFSQNVYFLLTEYNPQVRGATVLKRILFAGYRIIYSIGLISFIVVGVLLWQRRKLFLQNFAHTYFIFSFAVICSLIFLFFLLPDEREYLLPAIPFFIILCASLFTKKEFIIVSAILIFYAFVSVDVIKHNVVSPSPQLSLQQGFVVKEYFDRKEFLQWRKKISELQLPDSSIVMIGAGPIFWLENPNVIVDEELETQLHQDCSRSLMFINVLFVYGLNKTQLNDFQNAGYNIYYVDSMKDYLESFIGYKLEDEKVEEIKIE